MAEKKYNPARWFERCEDNQVKCTLCPRNCLIAENKNGFCGVRKNVNGNLVSIVYGRPSALNIDRIEKKPLYHFLPGTKTFSVGTVGCNLDCAFCQNHTLARGTNIPTAYYSPDEIVNLALKHDCESVALTYNEPTVWAEYGMDIAESAKRHSLKTVCVSNGYISTDSARDFYKNIDAANIDLKSFTNNFYKELTKSSLEPVLETLEYLHETGVHLEITNLIIPGSNDSVGGVNALLTWVYDKIGADVPLHFSAFFPCYKMQAVPSTPLQILLRIRKQAYDAGFKNVHLGNVGV
ncbi:MAG: AmmeMemoRadiSam system radical SAM enzyme [Verrucomicrobiota bacterium]|nr:AmmeMemoRadiSam system radical SAM enzyme [Verrucomicrobiota bacterium]